MSCQTLPEASGLGIMTLFKPMGVLLKPLCCGCLVVCVGLAHGQQSPSGDRASAPRVALPPGVSEDMLAPPPVPRFMLEKPGKPLTLDEMRAQVREAERHAGVEIQAEPANGAASAASAAARP